MARYRTFGRRDRQTAAQREVKFKRSSRSAHCHPDPAMIPLMYVPSLRRSAILRRS